MKTLDRENTPDRHGAAAFSSVLACVDGSPQAPAVLAWGAAVARTLQAPFRALRVLDMGHDSGAPHDPLAWELRRAEVRGEIGALLERAGSDTSGPAEVEVAVGGFHDRLQALLAGTDVDLVIIGAVGEDLASGRLIGDTARRVVESSSCSVLVVPPQGEAVADAPPSLRRLMVPLDCSRRAESALPAAVTLADAFGSELVVAHAVPEPALTEIGPPDEDGVALRRDVSERNRRTAVRYLSRLRGRLALESRPVRTLVLAGTDPRHQIVQTARDEEIDLVVLAAKGAGGYADQHLGSVADFLLTHVGKPLLIVRPASSATKSEGAGGRAPAAGRA